MYKFKEFNNKAEKFWSAGRINVQDEAIMWQQVSHTKSGHKNGPFHFQINTVICDTQTLILT